MSSDDQEDEWLQHREPEVFEGEVIEQKPQFRYVIRLDDGRVLPYCFIAHKDVGRRTDPEKFAPKVGERVWIEENPYEPGHARILINKRRSRK